MSKRKAYLKACIANGQTQTRDGTDPQTELDAKVAEIIEYKQAHALVRPSTQALD